MWGMGVKDLARFELLALARHLRKKLSVRPEYRIEKRPSLRNRQGMWALVNEQGVVLKRGHELAPVLAPIERRLMKLVTE